MNIIWYIFYPLTIGLGIFTFAFFKYPRYAIAGLIIAQPIIVLTWEYKILPDISFTTLYAGLFLVLGIRYIVRNRINLLQHSITVAWIIFLAANVISIFVISDSPFLYKLKYYGGIMGGFVTLAIFSHMFRPGTDDKFIWSTFLLSGIFPLLLWLLPMIMGTQIYSADYLRRIIGPFKGFWYFNFYALQTIICSFVYLAISNKETLSSRDGNCDGNGIKTIWYQKLYDCIRKRISLVPILLTIMILISIAMVYKCYSKAGWVILVMVFLLWLLLRKKYISALLVPIIVVIIILVNPFAQDFRKTFRNEIDYVIRGTADRNLVFRGRLSWWESSISDFKNMPTLNKLFGKKQSVMHAGDDYLMIFKNSGVIGLVTYLILLSITIHTLVRGYSTNNDVFAIAGILIFAMYVLASCGAHPLRIPRFQWFTWGMVGFVLSKQKSN